MTLRDFIGAICASTNRAQAALSNYRLDYLNQHMDTDEDGTMTPKMIDIRVGGEIVSVPSYTLCQSSDLNLNDVIVKGFCQITGFTESINNETEDAKIMVKPCSSGHNNCIELQLRFKATPDLETENLLVEQLHSQMSK